VNTSKLNIVHISTSCNGGAGRAAYRIHKSLLKNDINSSFLHIDSTSDENEKAYQANLSSNNSSKRDFKFFAIILDKLRWRLKKYFGINFKYEDEKIIELYNLIKDKLDAEFTSLPFSPYDILDNEIVKNADVIHLHWVAGLIDYPSFFSNVKKPIVWTLHDMNPFLGIFHYKEDELRNNQIAAKLDSRINKLKRKLIKKINVNVVFVTPSKWLLNESKNSKTFKNRKGVCIPNPIDTSSFFPKKNIDFKIKFDIPTDNIIFLFVVHSVEVRRKGFDLLIQSLHKLREKPITLFVLGEGNFPIEGLDIRYLGKITDDEMLKEYYSNSDAFIVSSREDNLPNVMLESISCGTPVIGFPVGGIKEHVSNFQTGILSNDLSAESLADAILKFCYQKEVFDRNFLHNYAIENFGENTIASKYIGLYNKIIFEA
jgi:glycosyltransferase involved in cell wall biosynthesis